MRAVLLPALLAGCAATAQAPAPALPPAPPGDVARACADPGLAHDAVEALIAHRLALADCRAAALVVDRAWRRIARGEGPR